MRSAIRDRKSAEARDAQQHVRALHQAILKEGEMNVEALMDETAAEFRSALEAWRLAPLDREAQTRINDAVWQGRMVWRLSQKVSTGARVKAGHARVPLSFQEPIVLLDKSKPESEGWR